jgi:hypothetical protein
MNEGKQKKVFDEVASDTCSPHASFPDHFANEEFYRILFGIFAVPHLPDRTLGLVLDVLYQFCCVKDQLLATEFDRIAIADYLCANLTDLITNPYIAAHGGRFTMFAAIVYRFRLKFADTRWFFVKKSQITRR